MKISCNVMNDILPLYADEVVCGDTRELVEEHLEGCAECAEKYRQMKREIEIDISEKAAEAEKQALVNAKKRVRKKRLITALLSVIAGAVILAFVIKGMSLVKIPVAYEKDRFEVVVREEGGEECLFLRYRGTMHGHEMAAVSEFGSDEEILYIELYTTPWGNLFGGENDDNARQEIFCGSIDDGEYVTTELRLIVGDIRQFYNATRDYEKLEETSVLLWEADDGLRQAERKAFIDGE